VGVLLAALKARSKRRPREKVRECLRRLELQRLKYKSTEEQEN